MPKLYFGSRGGVYYKKRGKKVYIKQSSFGQVDPVKIALINSTIKEIYRLCESIPQDITKIHKLINKFLKTINPQDTPKKTQMFMNTELVQKEEEYVGGLLMDYLGLTGEITDHENYNNFINFIIEFLETHKPDFQRALFFGINFSRKRTKVVPDTRNQSVALQRILNPDLHGGLIGMFEEYGREYFLYKAICEGTGTVIYVVTYTETVFDEESLRYSGPGHNGDIDRTYYKYFDKDFVYIPNIKTYMKTDNRLGNCKVIYEMPTNYEINKIKNNASL